MSAAPALSPIPPRSPGDTQSSARYTPGLSDGLGERLLMFDHSSASSLELLRFKREFSDAPGFEAALRARVDELGRFHHPAVVTVRSVHNLAGGEGLALVSSHVAGRRLSEMIQVARGIPFALDLIQQVAPALVALHQQGSALPMAHGLLTAERLIVTREGRVIIVEHVLARAFESLELPVSRFRADIGIPLPEIDGAVRFDPRTDVIQLGMIALSLLLGRRLDAGVYPGEVSTLLDEFSAPDQLGTLHMRRWLERALQLGDRPFTTAQAAQAAFSEFPAPRLPDPARTRVVQAFSTSADPAGAATAATAPVPDGAPAVAPEPSTTKANPKPAAASKGGWTGRITGRPLTILLWAVAALAVLAIGEALVITGMSFTRSAKSSTVMPEQPALLRPDHLAASTAPATAEGTLPVVPQTDAPAAATAAPTPTPTPAAPALDSVPSGTPRFGVFSLTAPIELQVFEAGKLVGTSAAPIGVREGSHEFEFVNEALGYRKSQTVSVKPGQMTPIAIAVPNGRLSINALPWAEVTINGKPAGETPLANLEIPIGRHEIVFRHPQFGEQRQTAVVKADGLTRVSVTFQK